MKRPFYQITVWLIVISTVAFSCKRKEFNPELEPSDPLNPVMSVGTDIVAGTNNSFIIQPDNSLLVAGYNYQGRLGYTSGFNTHFTRIMENVKSVSAGLCTSFIIRTDNSLWGTGNNSNGQLGDGTTINSYGFKKITENVKAVSTSINHSLIIKTDNSLWTVGGNSFGQLGDGTTIDKHNYIKNRTL